MYLIVGLGNPGSKFDYTRHNVGFMAIDKLADDLGVKVKKLKFKSLIVEARIGSEKVILMKPSTYMNESGRAVVDCQRYYNLDPSQIIVLCDDIDIDFGTIRIKKKGSAGTHNGLKSIIYQLNSQDFPRIKISVSKPEKNIDLKDFVLSRFSDDEMKILDKELDMARKAVLDIVNKDTDYAMNNYNGKSVI